VFQIKEHPHFIYKGLVNLSYQTKLLIMQLPDIQNKNVASFLQSEQLVQETADQIMKDFGLFSIVITFSGKLENAYNELHEQLIKQVSDLLVNDYQRLLSVLYQVDISDKEIEKAKLELPNYNDFEIIAHQIIVRDLKKVLTRHYFRLNP